MEVMHERNAHNFPLDLAAAEVHSCGFDCTFYWLIFMLKPFTALLCGAFLLSACTPKSEVKSSSVEDTEQRYEMCVAGYVETSPGKGTLDIFLCL